MDFITIPCVTLHYFFDEIASFAKVPVLRLIDETMSYIINNHPSKKRIRILATKGTFRGKIFEKAFYTRNLKTLVPDKKGQNDLMEAIYGMQGIKAKFISGYTKYLISKVANDLIGNGAEIIVGGCTEIPIAIGQDDIRVPFIDSLTVLAKAAIKEAGLIPKLS